MANINQPQIDPTKNNPTEVIPTKQDPQTLQKSTTTSINDKVSPMLSVIKQVQI